MSLQAKRRVYTLQSGSKGGAAKRKRADTFDGTSAGNSALEAATQAECSMHVSHQCLKDEEGELCLPLPALYPARQWYCIWNSVSFEHGADMCNAVLDNDLHE